MEGGDAVTNNKCLKPVESERERKRADGNLGKRDFLRGRLWGETIGQRGAQRVMQSEEVP